MKIVEDNGSTITVEFQDSKRFRSTTIYSNFKMGQIKNPYDVTVFNIGYLGVGKYSARENNKKMTNEYTYWTDILSRCYHNPQKYPAYFGICKVCDEWHNFQNYAKWYNENYYEVPTKERMHTDKDILIPGNTIYSPNTCLMVPQRINMLFLNKPNKRGLPMGISKTDKGYSAKYNACKLGTYDDIGTAFNVYAKRKELEIKRIADLYRKYIPEKLYRALYDYKVLIENDINYVA